MRGSPAWRRMAIATSDISIAGTTEETLPKAKVFKLKNGYLPSLNILYRPADVCLLCRVHVISHAV